MQQQIFRTIATEMVDNGYQDIVPPGWGPEQQVSYYRHPNPCTVSKVTIEIGDTAPSREERIEQLAAELRQRFHTPLCGWHDYTGEPWVNYRSDPYGIRSGIRQWLRERHRA